MAVAFKDMKYINEVENFKEHKELCDLFKEYLPKFKIGFGKNIHIYRPTAEMPNEYNRICYIESIGEMAIKIKEGQRSNIKAIFYNDLLAKTEAKTIFWGMDEIINFFKIMQELEEELVYFFDLQRELEKYINTEMIKSEYLYDGKEFYKNKEYEKAIESFNELINLEPTNSIYYGYRGHTYFNLKNYQKALEDANKAIILDEKNALLYANRGRLYYKLLNYTESIKDYSRAIILEKDKEEYYDCRGDCYYKLEEYQEAIENYTEVLKINPSNKKGYYKRGTSYYNLKMYEKSIDDYLFAINKTGTIVWSKIEYDYFGLCWDEEEE